MQPVDTPGTHKLTDEQAAQLQKMTGLRYTHVQTGVHGVGLNRAQRRRLSRRK